jgi:O-antigen/teichoic acid export membrane protein
MIQAVFYFYFIPAAYKKDILLFDPGILKKIAEYGLPMMFTGILGMGILQVDGIFIGKFLGLKDFAIYRNGAIEFPLAGIIFSSLVSVSVPYYLKLKEESGMDEVLKTKRRISQLSATIIFPLSIYLFFFSDFFVKAYLSEKYILSAPIFAWYNIALLVRFNDYQDLLIIHGKTKQLFYINLITFIICVVSNYFLIKNFGLTGAIISFLLNLYLIAILLLMFTKGSLKLSLNKYQNWSSIFTILFVSVFVGAVLFRLKNSFNNGFAVNVAASFLYVFFISVIFYKLNLLDHTLISKIKNILRFSNKQYEKID